MTKNRIAPDKSASKQPARTTPKSIETRSRIVRGALAAIEDNGIGEVTTRKIAKSANVQLATLHYHFENKEAVLLAVLDVLIEDMSVAYEADVDLSQDLDVRIEQLIRSIWRYVQRTRKTQVAQLELTLYALRTKGSEWLAARQYQAYIDFYRKLLVDTVGLPEDDAQDVSLTLGRFILSGVDGLMLQAFALNDNEAAQAGLETLIVATREITLNVRRRS